MSTCQHNVRGGCRVAAALASMSVEQVPVTEQQCATCLLSGIASIRHPTPQVVELANAARAGSVQTEEPQAAPPSVPCIHRSPEPVDHVVCRPCQNEGVAELPVHECALHGRCAVRGYAIEVDHVCLTCPDRAASADPARGFVFDRNNLAADHMAGMYRGATAFLVCGGPSFTSEDAAMLQARGVLVAAINNVAAMHVRPHLWFSSDACGRFHENIWRDPAIAKFTKYSRRHDRLTKWNARAERWTPRDLLPLDCPNTWFYEDQMDFTNNNFLTVPYVPFGRDKTPEHPKVKGTMFVALRMLHWLGVGTVCLLGCDFKMDQSKPYSFDEACDDGKERSNNTMFANVNRTLDTLRPHFERCNFNVVNCTPDSGLTAFNQEPLEVALERARLDTPPSVRGMYAHN